MDGPRMLLKQRRQQPHWPARCRRRHTPDAQAAGAVGAVDGDALVSHRVHRLAAIDHDFKRADGLPQLEEAPALRVDCGGSEGGRRGPEGVSRAEAGQDSVGAHMHAQPTRLSRLTCVRLRHPAQPERLWQAGRRLALPGHIQVQRRLAGGHSDLCPQHRRRARMADAVAVKRRAHDNVQAAVVVAAPPYLLGLGEVVGAARAAQGCGLEGEIGAG